MLDGLVSTTPQSDDPRVLLRVLVYGSPETRRHLVGRLIESAEVELWAVLAETVRSEASVALRARCLEVLGTAAGTGPHELAERILHMLVESPRPSALRRPGKRPEAWR